MGPKPGITVGRDARSAVYTVPNDVAASFQVRAQNQVGTSVAAVTLPVTPSSLKSPPAVPTLLSASFSASGESLHVSWRPETTSSMPPPHSFLVSLSSTADCGQQDVWFSGNATEGTVDLLGQPAFGVGYRVTVAAENAHGRSRHSNEVTVLRSSVPLAPTLLEASVMEGSTNVAFVTFVPPPSDGGSAITAYRVFSEPAGYNGTLAFPSLSPGQEAVVQVPSIPLGMTLVFRVVAVNALGESPASMPSKSVTVSAAESVLQAPQLSSVHILSPTSVRVALVAPPDAGYAPLSSIVCAAYPGDWPDNVWRGTAVAAGTPLSLDLAGLHPGVPTRISCRAHNSHGAGAEATLPPANVPPVVTPGTAPSPPRNVVAWAGTNRAQVTFDAPLSDNGRQVSTYTAISEPDGIIGRISGSRPAPITVLGLRANVAYRFRVVASSKFGESLPSAVSNAIVPDPVGATPLAPVISHTETGDGFVNLTIIISPAVSGALPLQWLRLATPQGADLGSHSLDVTLQPTDAPVVKTVTFSGEKNGSPQSYVAALCNAAGCGPYSTPSVPATPAGPPVPPDGFTFRPPAGVPGALEAAFSISLLTAVSNGSPVLAVEAALEPDGVSILSRLPCVPADPAWSHAIRFSGLSSGRHYTVQARAWNAEGPGEWTGLTGPVMPGAAPDAPWNLTALWLDSNKTSLLVTLRTPETSGAVGLSSCSVAFDTENNLFRSPDGDVTLSAVLAPKNARVSTIVSAWCENEFGRSPTVTTTPVEYEKKAKREPTPSDSETVRYDTESDEWLVSEGTGNVLTGVTAGLFIAAELAAFHPLSGSLQALTTESINLVGVPLQLPVGLSVWDFQQHSEFVTALGQLAVPQSTALKGFSSGFAWTTLIGGSDVFEPAAEGIVGRIEDTSSISSLPGPEVPPRPNDTTPQSYISANKQGLYEFAELVGVEPNYLFVILVLTLACIFVALTVATGLVLTYFAISLKCRPEASIRVLVSPGPGLPSVALDRRRVIVWKFRGVLLRILSITFYCVILTSSFQLYLDRSLGLSFFAAIVLLAYGIFSILLATYRLRKRIAAGIVSGDTQAVTSAELVATNLKYGCLYSDFKPSYWYFFAAVFLRKFVAAIVVGTAAASPPTQVALMLLNEAVHVLLLYYIVPFKERFLQAANFALALVRVVTVLFYIVLAALPESEAHASARSVFSGIVFALQIIVFAGFGVVSLRRFLRALVPLLCGRRGADGKKAAGPQPSSSSPVSASGATVVEMSELPPRATESPQPQQLTDGDGVGLETVVTTMLEEDAAPASAAPAVEKEAAV